MASTTEQASFIVGEGTLSEDQLESIEEALAALSNTVASIGILASNAGKLTIEQIEAMVDGTLLVEVESGEE